jgi:hypothetical protein
MMNPGEKATCAQCGQPTGGDACPGCSGQRDAAMRQPPAKPAAAPTIEPSMPAKVPSGGY